MIERSSYGEAVVRVSYSVEPDTGVAFEAVRESKVGMVHLPQAGQGVEVRYDPEHQDRFEVLTTPGEETPPPPGSPPTKEIGWQEPARGSYIRPDGTRGHR